MTALVIQTQRDCLGLYTPKPPGDEIKVWAKGETIWPYEPRVPDWRTKDPSEMTLSELVQTQNQELPSTSKITWSLGMDGTLSMDRESSNDDDGGNGLEAEAAYEEWTANRMAQHSKVIPYTEFPPDLRNRIQWEAQRFYSSDPVRMRMQPTPTGTRVQIIGLKLDPEQYKQVAKNYLQRLLDRGMSPSDIQLLGTIKRTKESIEQIRDEIFHSMPEGWYEEIYLEAYHQNLHPNRDNFLDLDLHGAHEEVIELTEEEEEMREQGYQVPREVVIRGAREDLRKMSPDAVERALWHGTIGAPEDIGHHWREEDHWYIDDEDETNDIPALRDPSGVKALAGLQD